VTVVRGPTLENVTVKSAAFIDHTDTQSGNFRYGLAMRASGEQYYAFTISPRTETWQILKHSADGFQVLAEGTSDSIQSATTVNKLKVDAKGSDFAFSINDEAVAQVTDPDYASGEVGFFVETFDESLSIAFPSYLDQLTSMVSVYTRVPHYGPAKR
jgi:hypothetical protein